MIKPQVKSKLELEELLAAEVSSILQKEIDEFGDASLLVSGGSTPKGFFEALSVKDMEWNKVHISLVDERFLPDGAADQNGTTVKKYLLSNHASKAKFYPHVKNPIDLMDSLTQFKKSIASIRKPFTVVVLGMGNDGHTASFFPDSDELKEVMDPNNENRVMIVNTPSSPYPRTTFTFRELIDAKFRFLHFYGEEKQKIYKEALQHSGYTPYPIQMFLNDSDHPIKLYSTI